MHNTFKPIVNDVFSSKLKRLLGLIVNLRGNGVLSESSWSGL